MVSEVEREDARAAQAIDREFFEKGDVIFEEGDFGNVAYIIEIGHVDIIKAVDDENVKIARLQPGEIFGEMAVIDNAPRMAAAVAATNCRLTVVPKKLFEDKLSKTDVFVRGLLSILMNNLRKVQEKRVKKPRSFNDVLLMMAEQLDGLRMYADKMTQKGSQDNFADQMKDELNKMQGGIEDLRDLAQAHAHKDQRDDVYRDSMELKDAAPLSDLSEPF